MKKLFALLTAALLVLAFNVPSFASYGEYLIDDADLLTDYEEEELLMQLEQINSDNDISVVIHTAYDTDGKEVYTYADDFYDNGDYLDDGLIFVISMAERDYYTSTAGRLVDSLTAYDLEIICEDVVPCLSRGDYYKAFSQYLSQLELFLNGELYGNDDDFVFAGDYENIYNNNNDYDYEYDYNYNDEYYYSGSSSSANSNLIFREVILVIIAVVIAVIITLALKSKMNTAVRKHDADDYVVQGSFNLTAQRDAFIGSTVTKRPLPKNNNTHHGSRPGGGGGVRMSSGGARHGGGGGKF